MGYICFRCAPTRSSVGLDHVGVRHSNVGRLHNPFISRIDRVLPPLNASGKMEEVAAPRSNKGGVETTGSEDGYAAHQSRPSELIRSRKDDGGGVRAELECVLPGRLDGRERASALGFDFLHFKGLLDGEGVAKKSMLTSWTMT